MHTGKLSLLYCLRPNQTWNRPPKDRDTCRILHGKSRPWYHIYPLVRYFLLHGHDINTSSGMDALFTWRAVHDTTHTIPSDTLLCIAWTWYFTIYIYIYIYTHTHIYTHTYANKFLIHVPCTAAAGEAGNANAPPIVVMQMEPEKRLSHKEVEQRRREKAKQVILHVSMCVHNACMRWAHFFSSKFNEEEYAAKCNCVHCTLVGTWIHKCVCKNADISLNR
jgi:hypothetical protein